MKKQLLNIKQVINREAIQTLTILLQAGWNNYVFVIFPKKNNMFVCLLGYVYILVSKMHSIEAILFFL